MYIVSGHMDGHGYGEAANDNASGTALVMEVARVLSMPDVQTDRSIRFVLWNNEETAFDGSRAYIAQRRALQDILVRQSLGGQHAEIPIRWLASWLDRRM